jgi:hypothetical protein
MTAPQTPQQAQQSAAAEPRAAPTSTPTPRQAEFDSFVTAMVAGTLPRRYALAPDGSLVDPQSYDPTQPPATWP